MFSTIIKELLAQKNVSQKDFLKELKLGDNTPSAKANMPLYIVACWLILYNI